MSKLDPSDKFDLLWTDLLLRLSKGNRALYEFAIQKQTESADFAERALRISEALLREPALHPTCAIQHQTSDGPMHAAADSKSGREWRHLSPAERLLALLAYNNDLLPLSGVAERFGIRGRSGAADLSNLHKCLQREAIRHGVDLRRKGEGTRDRDSAKQREVAQTRDAADIPRRQAAMEMVAAGKGRAEIAAALGVHPATISRWVKGKTHADSTSEVRGRLNPQLRPGRPPARYTAKDVETFFVLHHEEGMTMADVAKACGASLDTVHRALYGSGRFQEMSKPHIEKFGEPRVGTDLNESDVIGVFAQYWERNESADSIARRIGTSRVSILKLLNSKIERYAQWSRPQFERYGSPCVHKSFSSRNEKFILNTVRRDYPEVFVVGDADRHRQPEWLGRQRLDIWIPEAHFAIEYNGIQHYEAVPAFGGAAKLERQQEEDIRKLRLCEENGVAVLVIRYDDPVDREFLYTAIDTFLHGVGRMNPFSDWEIRSNGQVAPKLRGARGRQPGPRPAHKA
jgi:transposase